MEDKSNVSIFRGSQVEADTVHDFLAQQGIGSLIRNHMQETLDAGWVTATPDHAAEVFVGLEDEAKAMELLRNLFQGEAAMQNDNSGTAGQPYADRPPVVVVPQPGTNAAAETSRPLSPPTTPPSL